MLEKTFSVRSNAVRNARSALGKSAQQGVHFNIGGNKGAYTWSPIEGARPVGAAPIFGDLGPAIQESLAESLKKDAVEQPVPETPKANLPRIASARRKIKAPVARAKKVAKVANKARGRKVGRKSLASVVEVSGKRKRMFKLISSPNGASLDTLVKALGWQKHTVRGAVSTIASQFKVKVKSFRDERRGRVYRVA